MGSAHFRRQAAFTLVELLTVLAIISVLAAILLPVLSSARGKAREIVCNSNLRQIGLAFRMYTQDYDEAYPWGVDPTDRYTPQIWSTYPSFQAQIPFMPMIHEALQPYVKSRDVFSCQSDSGYDVEDFTGESLDARPSSFKRFGTSYNYRTEITFLHSTEGSIKFPSQVNVLMDAAGAWHGGRVFNTMRYNVLFADGHTKTMLRPDLETLWQIPL